MSSATAVHPSSDPQTRAGNAPSAHFSIVAHGDPGVLPRVIELFAKRGLVPTQCRAVHDHAGDGMLTIDLEMAAMARDLAEYIARCLRQIPLVDCVLTSETDGTAA